MKNKNSESSGVFFQLLSFIAHFTLRGLAFMFWIIFKIIGAIARGITNLLENYLDI